MPITDRSDASALIPEETVNKFLTDLPNYSRAASLFSQVRMSRGQDRVPVLSTLPSAYFVNGEAQNGEGDADAGYKRTTRAAWANKSLIAEEIAAVIPVPIAVVNDADFDLVSFFEEKGAEAIAEVLDAAVLFGVNIPSTWGSSVYTHATNAGHTVALGTATAAEGGIAEDLNQLFSLIEEDGYEPNHVAGAISLRGAIRSHRDADGRSQPDISIREVYGAPVTYPARGGFTSNAKALVMDTTQGILGVRTDVTTDILREATIPDPATGELMYNLAMQNMVAVRMSARFAWQVANTVRRDQKGKAANTISPFGVLTASAS